MQQFAAIVNPPQVGLLFGGACLGCQAGRVPLGGCAQANHTSSISMVHAHCWSASGPLAVPLQAAILAVGTTEARVVPSATSPSGFEEVRGLLHSSGMCGVLATRCCQGAAAHYKALAAASASGMPPSPQPPQSPKHSLETQANFLTCTLSCDHRVVDGAVGAQWLQVG